LYVYVYAAKTGKDFILSPGPVAAQIIEHSIFQRIADGDDQPANQSKE